uniref:Proteasome activator complex subunit 2 n=1 Tax=Salarias fasciatus TaxID=181472 RepID=A0A672GYC9_SALFA
MSKASTLRLSRENAGKVENFRQSLFRQAEDLFCNSIPLKIIQLDALLKDEALSITDMSSLHAPLDIPIPDPPAPEDEEMETDKNEEEEKKKKKKAPKCGFIKGNEKIMMILDRVKPEIVALRETIIAVSCWIQYLIPKIEDGNDFGVAIQEKILERIAAIKTKMDYRLLVHEKDESIYCEIRVIVLDIRGFYAELYDIICKNLEKVTNPKGEEKSPMY